MTLRPDLYTPDFKCQPYWWDTTSAPPAGVAELPRAVDVAVLGSGYTGLHAAIQTARGGRQTLILDAEQAGWGCSTRNGGQVSTSIKPSLPTLAKRYGHAKAMALLQEGQHSLRWLKQFVAEHNIACDFAEVGRFHAAHNSAQFKKLKQQVDNPLPRLDAPYLVTRAQQRQELGTDAYYGGVVWPRHASLNPAKYHRALLDLATQSGAAVATHCPVLDIQAQGRGYRLTTPRGVVKADKVVLATNGYTGPLTPWQRRRIIPIGSYLIATEPLDAAQMQRLMPTNRVLSDSRKVVYYYRPSPDRTRILFGGRVSHAETDPLVSAPRLHRDLVALFPELAGVRISHSWMGFVAYTFDSLMHIGQRHGLHYAMGYCGSGVGMASYLGMKMGLQVLGAPAGQSAFDSIRFPTLPFYTGRAWFLAASVFYYRWRDRVNI